MATITVFLADDYGSMLKELREELSREFHIAGVAENGEDAVRGVLSLDPDVLVLDITMPVMSGLQAAKKLHEIHSRTKILFLTIHEDPEYISAAFSAGANGYVSKRRLANDLVRAIREVSEGGAFLSPNLSA